MVNMISRTTLLCVLVSILLATSSWASLFRGGWQSGVSTGTSATLSLLATNPTSHGDIQRTVAIVLFGFDISQQGRAAKEQLTLLNDPKVTQEEALGNITESLSAINSSDGSDKRSLNSPVVLRFEDSMSPLELFQRKSEIAIGFLKTTQLTDSDDRVDFIAFIKAFVDGLLSRKSSPTPSSPRLFLIIDGSDSDVAALNAEVQAVIKNGLDSKLLECRIFRASDVDAIATEVLQSATAFVGQTSTLSPSPTSSSSSPPPPTAAAAAETRAASLCAGLAEELLVETKAQLLRSLPSGMFSAANTFSAAAVASTVQNVQAAVQTAVKAHAERHADTLQTLRGGAALQAASYRYRALLLKELLLPLHRQLLDSTSAQSIELLDRRLVLNSPPGEGQGQPAQTPPAESRVRRRLLQLAESTLSEHQAVAEIFTTAFRGLVTGSGEGLLASGPTSAGSSSWLPVSASRASHMLLSVLDTKTEFRRLRTLCMDRVQERMRALVLAGSVNPFLRDSPLPPTHINLNYLVDPRGLNADWQLKGLYDAQDESGKVRADPLQFPAIAEVPFDPTEHPIPKSKDTPWHKVLMEFFLQDD